MCFLLCDHVRMGQKFIGVTVIAFLVLVSGCGSQEQRPDPVPQESSSSTATSAAPEQSEEPVDPPPTAEVTEAAPAPDETTVEAPVAFDFPTDIPSDVMLSDADLYTPDASNLAPVRTETEGLAPWFVTEYDWPDTCVEYSQVPAVAMRTVLTTDERSAYHPDVQQVAVFEDDTLAQQELDRWAALLEACDQLGTDDTLVNSTEAFPVGDTQGFAYVLTGEGAPDNYLALFRRGNSVTLLWNPRRLTPLGIDQERVLAVEKAAKAWPLLCRYDPAGC